MLGVGAVVVVALVVVLIAVLSGGSSSKHGTTGTAASGTTAAGGATTSTTSTSGSNAQVVGQTNLNPPTGSSSAAKGVAFVVKEATKNGTAYGIIIEAAHVPPNNHNSYAAWLYNSATDAYRIGFVSPAVGKSGQFQVGSALPTNAGHFKQLLVTVETQTNPKAPGPILLQGPFKGVPATG
jgi:hypothetical protein